MTFVLAAPPRADEDFETKDRKLDADGKPLTRYTVAVAGLYGLDQFVIKAPECPGAHELAPLTPIRFTNVTGGLYKPGESKNLSGISFAATAANPIVAAGAKEPKAS